MSSPIVSWFFKSIPFLKAGMKMVVGFTGFLASIATLWMYEDQYHKNKEKHSSMQPKEGMKYQKE